MKFILGIFINIVVFSVVYFLAILYVNIDIGVKYIDCFRLAKEAFETSLKFHVVILPVLLLFKKGGR